MKETESVLQLSKKADLKKTVDVHRNLTHHCFSVRQDDVVIGYADELFLSDVRFVVRQAAREEVLKSGHKNVHAFVRGYLALPPDEAKFPDLWRRAYYDPFNHSQFVDHETKEDLDGAKYAKLHTIKLVDYIPNGET